MTKPNYRIRYDKKKKCYRANVKNLDPKSTSPQKSFYGQSEEAVLNKINEYFRSFDVPVGKTVDAIANQLFTVHNLRFAKSTLKNYTAIYAKRFAPVIGSKRIKKVTPDDIMHILHNCAGEGLSGKTINNIGCVIRAVFRFAVEQQYIREDQNSSIKCCFPKKEKVAMRSLAETEIEAILFTSQTDPYYALFSFIINTGLRRNEALGLCWSNINFIAKTLTVKRQLVRTDGTYKLLPPKEYRRRTIKLNDEAIMILKRLKEKQARDAVKDTWNNDQDFVFANSLGNHFVMETVDRHFKKVTDKAGIPDASLHTLRHTFATRLYEATGNIELVREYLGHKDIATTMRYYCHPSMCGNGMSSMMAMAVLPSFGILVNCHAE